MAVLRGHMLYVTAVNTGLFTHFHFLSFYFFFYLLSEEEFDPFKSKAKVQ